MRYHALACDFDGTLATEGQVPGPVVEALEQLRRSGRMLLLVTGRTAEDFLDRNPVLRLFARVILENGALMFRPETGEFEVLARRPPPEFLRRLKERGVSPLVSGKVIVATLQPQEATVLEVIRELGLEWQVTFNKGAVMALPSGISKASGLEAALRELKLSPHNVVGVGDAENDHAFLERCECAVAVANALPALKEKVDWVTPSAEGMGVVELAGRLLSEDLAGLEPRLFRREILLGEEDSGQPLHLSPHGRRVLISGATVAAASALAVGILEQLVGAAYQVCVVDPEGLTQDLEGLPSLGGKDRVPSVKEAIDVLDDPRRSLSLNLRGLSRESRPSFLRRLLPALASGPGRAGRPHWIVVNDAHQLLSEGDAPAGSVGPEALLLITREPGQLAAGLRSSVDVAIFPGEDASERLNGYLALQGLPPVCNPRAPASAGEALVWAKARPTEALFFRSLASPVGRPRRRREHAGGDVGPDKSFTFKG